MGGFHFNNRKYADDDLIVGQGRTGPPGGIVVFENNGAGLEAGRLLVATSMGQDFDFADVVRRDRSQGPGS